MWQGVKMKHFQQKHQPIASYPTVNAMSIFVPSCGVYWGDVVLKYKEEDEPVYGPLAKDEGSRADKEGSRADNETADEHTIDIDYAREFSELLGANKVKTTKLPGNITMVAPAGAAENSQPPVSSPNKAALKWLAARVVDIEGSVPPQRRCLPTYRALPYNGELRVPCGTCEICANGDPALCEDQEPFAPCADCAEGDGNLCSAHTNFWNPPTVLNALGDAARGVFDDPRLFDLLCRHCATFENVVLGDDGLAAEVFCGSCLCMLNAQRYNACACGKPRCLDKRAEPTGVWCKDCHKERLRQRATSGAARRGRGRAGRYIRV